MLLRRVLVILGALALVAACGTAASEAPSPSDGTVPVGALPGTLVPTSTTDPALSSTPFRTTTPISPDAQVGARVHGNRVILIGDSVMASTASRYGGQMCDALVPLGWQAEVDAETSRFIEFGDKVLDQRLSAGWDAAVILLGNNYRGDQQEYLLYLDHMIRRLSPAPVVLLTVTEFDPSRAKVNEVIFNMAELYDNVIIVDWAATTAADDSLTVADGLHLTDAGRKSLALHVALALGEAPVKPGACLPSTFTDDSGGGVTGGPATPTTTVRHSSHSTTTTTTTAGRTSSTTTVAAHTSSTAAPATTVQPPPNT